MEPIINIFIVVKKVNTLFGIAEYLITQNTRCYDFYYQTSDFGCKNIRQMALDLMVLLLCFIYIMVKIIHLQVIMRNILISFWI